MTKIVTPEPGSQMTMGSITFAPMHTHGMMGPALVPFIPPQEPTEAMLDAMRCQQGCVKPCLGCDAEAKRYWKTMYAAALKASVDSRAVKP